MLIQKILHADDTPHAIALGAAIAMLVAFLPLIGLQTVIAIGLAAAFRANKAVCVPIVWITNPFSLVPIYGACFGLGRLVLSSHNGTSAETVLSKLPQPRGIGVLTVAFWKSLPYQLAGVALEMWVGCAIVGTVAAVASYFAARWGVSRYRERRRKRLLRRSLMRSNVSQRKVLRSSESA